MAEKTSKIREKQRNINVHPPRPDALPLKLTASPAAPRGGSEVSFYANFIKSKLIALGSLWRTRKMRREEIQDTVDWALAYEDKLDYLAPEWEDPYEERAMSVLQQEAIANCSKEVQANRDCLEVCALGVLFFVC